jgi:ABC-type phosphate/phosphonate transport system substrate-binding protein
MNRQIYGILWSVVLFISAWGVWAEEQTETAANLELKEIHESRNLQPAPEKVLRIGILAKLGSEEGIKMWAPVGEYLTKHVPPYTFEIVPLAFNEIHLSVRRRTIDFILTNPKFYMELESLYGLGRIATLNNVLAQGRTSSLFGGVIFTKSSRGDIRTYQDLKAKSFMAVDKLSFGGWQVSLCEFKHNQIDPNKHFSSISFGGTHDAVVYAVRDGVVDAGTVRTDTLERLAAEGKIKLEDFFILNSRQYEDFPLFLSTELYPEWSFAKTQKVPDKLATQVSIALMQMSSDEPAAISSKSAGWVVPHNYQKVEDCLKELGGESQTYLNNNAITAPLSDNTILGYWCWIIITLLTLILGVMIIMRD